MKKILTLLLILSVLVFYGCSTKEAAVTPGADNVTAPASQAAAGNPSTSAASISSDIESISKEAAGIDINDTGIKPLTDADITVD